MAAEHGFARLPAYDRPVIVALNIGNTNINFAALENGEAVGVGSAPTVENTSESALGATLDKLLRDAGSSLAAVDEMVLVSVVPEVTGAALKLADVRGIRVLVADATTIPIEIRVDRPEHVGNDRLVNAYAALRLHGAPVIVVDLGTATTFDAVNADGAFIGGAIAAGAGLGLGALAEGTAQLPPVPLVMPQHAIGGDTVSAMQSGAVIGHSGLVLVLIRAITDELTMDGDPKPKVILTGGLSSTDWAQAIPSVDVIDPYLTLEGLARLHQEVGQPAGAHA
jgi:type III pantothenate kinase